MRATRTAMAAALLAAAAATLPASADYLVKEVGSFHVGGRTTTLSGMPTREVVFTPGSPALKVDPNGEFEVEQMYVQFVKLAQPKAKVPILFWHGGGLTGVTWETKPDGKPGWQQWFLNAGYDVYVSDAVERGRASWARYPEIFKSEPMFRTKKEAWELFRIGPSYEVGGQRATFEGEQFPTEAFDQFMKQGVPRWVTTDDEIVKAYIELVDKICPCVVLVHSQSGTFGYKVLEARSGEAAMLYYAAPGAAVPGHGHRRDEECLMLEGELFLDDQLRKGMRLLSLQRCIGRLPPAPGRRPSVIHALLAARVAGYDPGELSEETLRERLDRCF